MFGAKDKNGKKFTPGQTIARAPKKFQAGVPHIEMMEVTRVVGRKVYVDNSTKPLEDTKAVVILV